jgi:hypothetical protein
MDDLITAPLTSTVLAFALTSVGATLAYLLRPRVKLLWAQGNIFAHRMHPNTDKEFLINTGSYIVINRGRVPAKDVEFVLNFKVDEISVWPQRQYTVEMNPEGRQIVRFATFAPKEIATVNIINMGKALPKVLNVRNAESVGRMIEVYPQQRLPKYFTITIWFLLIFGIFFVGREIISFALRIVRLVWT